MGNIVSIPPQEQVFSSIEIFPNQYPDRRYTIEIVCPEFTAVCPKTGLPDFGTITIAYQPAQYCLELKAFKYYLLDYRQVGIFYENAVNRILNDVIHAVDPHYIEIKGTFSARGGIHTNVVARHERA